MPVDADASAVKIGGFDGRDCTKRGPQLVNRQSFDSFSRDYSGILFERRKPAEIT